MSKKQEHDCALTPQESAAIRRVGIIAKHNIAEKAPFLRELDKALKKMGKEVMYDTCAGPVFGQKGFDKARILRSNELVIVLGGDGTLLKTAHHMGPKQPLILGVNMGTLGFMTALKPQKLIESLPKVFAGDFCLDERYLLRVTSYRDGKKFHTTPALNEAVINQGGFARLIDLTVSINQRKLATYKADGLIISSPTGSTGHSLSAGGPILHPKVDAFVLTPLCPVKLGARPIVIPDDRQITITLETQWRAERKPIVLTVDGQITVNLKRGDLVRIRRSSRAFRMIRLAGHNYYRMLSKKLNWGG
ncbi:NAD(+) kinase [Candidatus Peregrinibacteria bacterium CG_4_9_14_0_2_um_filter_53_11]|nr:MAG: NAD(+) kinase [Candidatus Peregrinibacteria bacterium CG_4_9_14_0_2_um_filter_53_11]